MKIAVIGATGFVGTHIINELAGRDHDLLGISRTLQLQTAAISFIALDIFNTAALADTLQSFNIVVSAYNPGWLYNPLVYEEYLQGAQSIQEAVRLAGVQRLIVIGGAGSLYNEAGMQLVDTTGFPAEIKPGAVAARDYLAIIKKEQAMDWVFFSPPKEMHAGITTGRTGHYRLGTDYPVLNEEGKNMLSVEDLAVVIADEIEKPRHHRTRFTAAY